jgi:hypothetical protein
MELYWNQYAIANFYPYIDIFYEAFVEASGNVSGYVLQVYNDFPIQESMASESSLFNEIGAILAIAGSGIDALGGPNPYATFIGDFTNMVGGIFSLLGSLSTASPPNTVQDLGSRLSTAYTQVTDSAGALLSAVMVSGDLSAYPSWIYSGSHWNISLVALTTDISSTSQLAIQCRTWFRCSVIDS